ncbi:MAG: hypothetical protein U0I48_01150, partial [Acutalibacteraceae bacterium]|nr:hypothetical protein [Acutalibacteraceae bacterium]
FSLVGGKVIAKEENHRNGFPLLNKHIKFFQEFHKAECSIQEIKKRYVSQKTKKQVASKKKEEQPQLFPPL